MVQNIFSYRAILPLFFLLGCRETPKEIQNSLPSEKAREETIVLDSSTTVDKKTETEFVLTEDNAIDFFFKYSKTLKENKVKLTTNLGNFTVQLYDNVPYHKANFMYLTEKGYFNGTLFHRVVKDFIIQGGNADTKEVGLKRTKIGHYLLPPDTRKGYRHDRGILSMPSSEIDNPHMLASPYEFFIVVTKPGSYHLDGDYTPFGKVIEGMDVVDLINRQPVDKGDWPSQNIYILKAEVVQ